MTTNPLAAVASMVSQIEQQYPAFAPLMAIPDIAKLLIEASQPGAQWTSQKFQAAIEGTNWWRTTSQPARQWQTLKLTQPGEASRQSAQTAVQIHQLAAQEGILLTPADLASLVDNAQKESWNAAQIQQAVGQQAGQKTLTAGTIQNTATQLGQTAQSYGLPLSDHTKFAWAQRIAEGTATTDGFNAYAQDQAKLMFPTLAKHIDQGMTVRQLADPYLQIAGQTLGVDPNALELTDPKWIAALQAKNAQGVVTGPMSQQDWQTKIMNDPVYGYDHTVNAQESASNLVQQLGQTFGVVKP